MTDNKTIEIWGAPRTRAVRVVWLMEELGLDYQLNRVEFKPTTSAFYIQDTPTGKIPTLKQGDTLLCESAAICQYLLARHDNRELQPPVDDPSYGEFLQWMHMAEGTTFPPLGVLVWLTTYRDDAEQHPQLVEDALSRAHRTLQFVEDHLEDKTYLLGDKFSAADIMMGFTVVAAQTLGALGELPALQRYLAHLLERPAAQRALAALS